MATAPAITEIEQPISPFDALSDAGKDGLRTLLRQALDENRITRRWVIKDPWKLRLYCKGIQQLWYDSTSYMYCGLGASPFELPRHRGVFDITSPHKRSFVSILSENPLGINFVPNDLQQSVDVTAAKLAEKMRLKVDREVQMKEKQAKAAGYLCTDGFVCSWTRINEKGKLCIDMGGMLEWTVPLYEEDKDDWTFAVYSKERNIWRAKSTVTDPELKKKIVATPDEAMYSMYERYARLSVVSDKRGGSADTFKNLVTEHYAWIDPCRYPKLEQVADDEITAAFPSGVRIHAFGQVVVDAIEETMDCLAVEHPVDGEGQIRPALLSGVPDIQDAFNDSMNIDIEKMEYGIPASWINGAAVDSEAMPEQRSEPGVMHVINPPNGLTVADCIYKEPPPDSNAESAAMRNELKQTAEFNTGDFPALYGGDTEGQDTVGVNKLLNNQAKGQLGPAWAALQRLGSKIYPVAIRLAAQQSADSGSVAIKGQNGQESFNPAAILDGNFGCNPDQDSSFPETTADKRASLQAVLGQLGQGEQGQAIVFAPDNLKLIKQYSGLTDLIIPGSEARDKQLREIEQLLQETPIPQASPQGGTPLPNQQMGIASSPQPPQFTPSVPIDPQWDYHQPELDKVKEWLSSDARYEEERKGNLPGIENVKLHGMAHQAQLDKIAQANAPKVEPPKVSLTMQVTDPNTIAQFAQAAGATTTTPQDIAASQVPDQQVQAADTQHKAAQAQHQAVLAAKEAVAPAQGFIHQQPPSKQPTKE